MCLLALGLAAGAGAQEAPPPGPAGSEAGAAAAHADAARSAGIADVPSGPARLTGRVVHGDDPARAAGVEVLLYALPPSGVPGVRRATTDDAGRFAFEGLSNDPQTAWLVGARHAGVPFPGTRFSFAAGETEREVEIRIGEPTGDASQVVVRESELRLLPRGGRLLVTELHRFENRGERTVYVPRDARAGREPAFATALPETATDFQVPLGIAPEGLVYEEGTLRFYGPIYPSRWPDAVAQEQGLVFSYAVPASGDVTELARRFSGGAERVTVLAPEGAPPITVAGAREVEPQEIEGERYRRWVVDGLAPGAPLALAVEVPPARADRDAVRLDETRIFLELDDAALLVREEHHLTVTGDTAVVAPPDGPLLHLPLPPGAADLRFDREAFQVGLAPADGGGAVIEGPLPPGSSTIALAYHLPVPDPEQGIVFEKRFGAELPLLSIYVADTGLRFASERLHRRRPVATPDRTYLHLEAFQVAPTETVALSLAPLRSDGAGLPRAVPIGVVLLLVGAAALFLGAPLRAGRAPERLAAEEEDAARREREAVYAALRDLEHDHETGKIADEDYAAMRHELRSRAAALIEAERAQATAQAPAPAAATPAACPACRADVRPGDRFCAHCGQRLAPSPAAAEGELARRA